MVGGDYEGSLTNSLPLRKDINTSSPILVMFAHACMLIVSQARPISSLAEVGLACETSMLITITSHSLYPHPVHYNDI